MVDSRKSKTHKVWKNGYNMSYEVLHLNLYVEDGNTIKMAMLSLNKEQVGFISCKNELAENVDCQNKEELLAREGFYQQEQ